MTASKINKAFDGVGLGFRHEFWPAFQQGSRLPLAFLEVVSENFLPLRGKETAPIAKLRTLRRDYPIALHGVSLSLGSADPCRDYLERLKWLVDAIEPWQVSDHLCWTGVDGENLHDLLPLPLNRESLEHVAGRIHEAQEILGRSLAIENITAYLRPPATEMSEAFFLNELAARTGCSFLLDLNNIYVNSVNLGGDPLAFLSELDLSGVSQVHLAGHTRSASGILLDSHGASICEEVWELYAWLLTRSDNLPTMIERDQNFPAWAEMEKELERIRSLQRGRGRDAFNRVAAAIQPGA